MTMRAWFLALPLCCAVAVAAPEEKTGPQKIAGTIETFAAPVLTVKTAAGETVAVTLMVQATVIAEKKSSLAEIKAGDFISATVEKDKKGKLKAEELRVLPESMRGVGEGFYTAATGRLMSNATVDAFDLKARVLKLGFHGTLAAADGTCSGHASAPGKGLCNSQIEVSVPAKAPVLLWVPGETSWLEAGKTVSLYGTPGADGKLLTPGVIVEHAVNP
jgi:hypothetical protein